MKKPITLTPENVRQMSDADLSITYIDQFDVFFGNDNVDDVRTVRAEVRRRGLTRDQIDSYIV